MMNKKHAEIALASATVALAVSSLIESNESDSDEEMLTKKCWVKEWRKKRGEKDSYTFLTKELEILDKKCYKNFLRMDKDCFMEILNDIRPDITKQDTIMRPAISAEEKLAVTLRFLATGESFQSLEYQTRLSIKTISEAIDDVCIAIYKNMQDKYLKCPQNKEEWKKKAEDFGMKWQFPLCIGALDGKHIRFKAPKKDGGRYYNYKGYNSIVLLAVTDANYKFSFIDIGCNGRISDGGVLNRSDLRTILNRSNTFLPGRTTIGNNRCLPYVIVGDDAFPLEEHIMKPYSYHTQDDKERNFNLRLSRARQCVENSFGILTSRFRIFETTISLNVNKIKNIVKACCVLHNFLIDKNKSVESCEPHDEGNGHLTLNSNLPSRSQNVNNSSVQVKAIRKEFSEYFFNEGHISWLDLKKKG